MSFQTTATVAARKPITAALSAAVAAVLGSAAVSSAQSVEIPGVSAGVNNVTSVTTRLDTGTATSVTGVTGAPSSNFNSSAKFTVNYAGDLDRVLTATAGGTTYAATGLATNVVRRFVGPNNDQLWYTGTFSGNTSGSTVSLNGPALGGFTQAFDSNSLNVGADNLFSTKATGTGSNPVGNTTNVDRVDMLFSTGLTTSTGAAFVVTDRGASNDHDAFDVAAITSLDANGNPASYGPLLAFKDGTWGTANLTSPTEEVVLRKNDNLPNDTFHPSDFTSPGQAVGGVALTTAALDGGVAGQTIYGYSLFSADMTVTGNGSGTQLVNYTNSSVYGLADSTSTEGGLDPAATIAVLYTSNTPTVPEPATATLATSAAAGLLLSRRRKGASRRAAAVTA